MTRAELITNAIRTAPENTWTEIEGLPGWKVEVVDKRVTLHVPVTYIDPDYPGMGYTDYYGDLPAPFDAGVEEDGTGEWWCFHRDDFA